MADMPVEIVDFDPRWPSRFETERQQLEGILRPWTSGGVHHVGSTAVPGLAAKPVIDIMVGVHDLTSARDAIPALRQLDYRFWEQDPHRWRLWFLKPEPAIRTHHLHLVDVDHPEYAAKLAFRDLLQRDPQARRDYEQLKRELADAHPHDRDAYTDGKTSFVRSALERIGAADGVPPRDYVAARKAAGADPGEAPGVR